MGKSTDILAMPEALPGLGVYGVVFHNGKGYYYTCKEYCSSIDKRTYECVKPDCKGTANIGSLGSSMVEICRHNHAPDYSYRKKCVVFHLILQRFIEEHGSPIAILQDILTSLAETLDTNADSNLQEDTVGYSTNVVKSNPVTPTVSDRSRKSRRHSLRRSSSGGRLTEETQSQSSEIPETPADCVPTENDDHSSEDGLEAQPTKSSPDFKLTTGTASAQSASSGEKKRRSLRFNKKTPATEEEQPCSQPMTSQTRSTLIGSEPHDRFQNENYFSDDNFDAQDDDSFKKNDDKSDTDPDYTPSSKRKKFDPVTPVTRRVLPAILRRRRPRAVPVTMRAERATTDLLRQIAEGAQEPFGICPHCFGETGRRTVRTEVGDGNRHLYDIELMLCQDNECSSVCNDSQEDVEDDDVDEESGHRQTHSLNRKKYKEFETNQQKQSVSKQILIQEIKSEIEIVDTIATNFVEPSKITNQAKEMPALLSVLGLEQLVDHQRQSGEMTNFDNDLGDNETFPRKKRKSKMVQRNRYTWSREEEIRAAIAEGRCKFGQIEFFISMKDKINLISNNYIYTKRYEKADGQTKWVCTNANKCYCSIDLAPDLSVLREGQHLCTKRDDVEIEIKKTYNVIKRRVLKESTRVATIYKQELAKLKERGIVVPSGYLHHSTFYDYRKKLKQSEDFTVIDFNESEQETEERAPPKSPGYHRANSTGPQNSQKEYHEIETVFLNDFIESNKDDPTPAVECPKLIKFEECFVMENANWNESVESAHGHLPSSSSTSTPAPNQLTQTTSSTAEHQLRSFAAENAFIRFIHL